MLAIAAALAALSEQLKSAPEFAKDPQWVPRVKFSQFKCKGKRDASLRLRANKRKARR